MNGYFEERSTGTHFNEALLILEELFPKKTSFAQVDTPIDPYLQLATEFRLNSQLFDFTKFDLHRFELSGVKRINQIGYYVEVNMLNKLSLYLNAYRQVISSQKKLASPSFINKLLRITKAPIYDYTTEEGQIIKRLEVWLTN